MVDLLITSHTQLVVLPLHLGGNHGQDKIACRVDWNNDVEMGRTFGKVVLILEMADANILDGVVLNHWRDLHG